MATSPVAQRVFESMFPGKTLEEIRGDPKGREAEVYLQAVVQAIAMWKKGEINANAKEGTINQGDLYGVITPGVVTSDPYLIVAQSLVRNLRDHQPVTQELIEKIQHQVDGERVRGDAIIQFFADAHRPVIL